MPQERDISNLYVVIISNIRERNELLKFCTENNIEILFPSLFQGRKCFNLWGISKGSVGLVSTIIAKHTPQKRIVYSVYELRNKSFN